MKAIYSPVTSIEELKAKGNYAVVTPEECIELARGVEELNLHPLMGGLPASLSWPGILKSFASKVLPALMADLATVDALNT